MSQHSIVIQTSATKLARVEVKSRQEPEVVFSNLGHIIDESLLRKCFNSLDGSKAIGIDGVTKVSYGENLEKNLQFLLTKIRKGTYIPKPSRVVEIPKLDGTTRPLAIACVEDKIVQEACKRILERIFEPIFLTVSFGFRPGSNQHKAIVALNGHLNSPNNGAVLDVDLRKAFDTIPHNHLEEMLERKISDKRFLYLLMKLIKAEVIRDSGEVEKNTCGVPQGSILSVLLSNIYLHYVLDLWLTKVVKPRMQGECYFTRYLDDFVVCFQFRADAIRFQKVLPLRLGKFGLELEPSKTKLVEFGRFSQRHAKERGRKQETIYFLGFTHYCTRNRKGNYEVGRKTEKSRLRRSLAKLKEKIARVQQWSLKDQAKSINEILRGHYGYYGLGGNMSALQKVHRKTEFMWRRSLGKRCWKGKVYWEEFNKLKKVFPLQRPKLRIPFAQMQSYALL